VKPISDVPIRSAGGLPSGCGGAPLDREGTQITSVCTPELITAKVLMTAPNGGSSRSVSGWMRGRINRRECPRRPI